MPENKQIAFTHTELAEILVKKLDLHEGFWAIYFDLGLGGANVPTTPDQQNLTPAGIVFIKNVGLLKSDSPNSLTVDAAKVNPRPDAIPPVIHKAD
jgi:hypothetical protein